MVIQDMNKPFIIVAGFSLWITHAEQNRVAKSTMTRKYAEDGAFHDLRSIASISLNSVANGVHTIGLAKRFCIFKHVMHFSDISFISFIRLLFLMPAFRTSCIKVFGVG